MRSAAMAAMEAAAVAGAVAAEAAVEVVEVAGEDVMHAGTVPAAPADRTADANRAAVANRAARVAANPVAVVAAAVGNRAIVAAAVVQTATAPRAPRPVKSTRIVKKPKSIITITR